MYCLVFISIIICFLASHNKRSSEFSFDLAFQVTFDMPYFYRLDSKTEVIDQMKLRMDDIQQQREQVNSGINDGQVFILYVAPFFSA